MRESVLQLRQGPSTLSCREGPGMVAGLPMVREDGPAECGGPWEQGTAKTFSSRLRAKSAGGSHAPLIGSLSKKILVT